MNVGIELIIDNIGMALEWIISLIFILGSFIFMAKDFKLGMIVLFTTMGGVFVWFYQAGLEYKVPLVVFFISLIILALTLYPVNATSQTGGFSG